MGTLRTLWWVVRSVLASSEEWAGGLVSAAGMSKRVSGVWLGDPQRGQEGNRWGLGGHWEVCPHLFFEGPKKSTLGYLEVIRYIGDPTSVKATIVLIFIYFNLLQNHQSSVAVDDHSDFESDSFGFSIFLWRPLQTLLYQWCLNISWLVRSTSSWETEKDQICCCIKCLLVYLWSTCDVCQVFPLTGVACLLILIDYCWLALLREKKKV